MVKLHEDFEAKYIADVWQRDDEILSLKRDLVAVRTRLFPGSHVWRCV